jgi:hypothetical protein
MEEFQMASSNEESQMASTHPEIRVQELELQRYKATLDFRRSIIIGGFVALAIALIPPLFQLASGYIKHREFEDQLQQDTQSKTVGQVAESQKFRSEYISAFLNQALNEKIELRLRLAEYFGNLAQGDERAAWINYFKELHDRRELIRDQIEGLNRQLATLQKHSQSDIEQDRLIRRINWLSEEVGYIGTGKKVLSDDQSLVQAPDDRGLTLESIDQSKRPIAQKIIDAFSAAGFTKYQQAAALADAIIESDLDPKARTPPPEESFGVFPLNINGGLGAGYTPEQLEDPDTNIGIVVTQAKRTSPFVNAVNFEQASSAFVRLISRPSRPSEATAKVIAIGRNLFGG